MKVEVEVKQTMLIGEEKWKELDDNGYTFIIRDHVKLVIDKQIIL